MLGTDDLEDLLPEGWVEYGLWRAAWSRALGGHVGQHGEIFLAN